MAVASPVDVAVNPNNTGQRLILWSNGRIDAIGGAPPAVGNETWYDRVHQVAVAIHVSNWSTGAGYVLDIHGSAHPFGGAPDIMVDHDADSSTWPQIQGVPYSFAALYVDWSWNPDGSGKGYILDAYGQVIPFGGADAPPRWGRRFSTPVARKLEVQWTPDIRVITLTGFGGLYGDFAAVVGAHPDSLGAPTLTWDAIRDFVVTDWASGSGYMVDLYGGMHDFGTAPRSWGWPYSQGGDVARTLSLLSDGDPLSFLQVWAGGQQFEWISSTPPAVVAGGVDHVSPAGTVTGTTRPDLLWAYNDPQGDSQAEAQVLVFTQAFATGHNMGDPLAWTQDALVARDTTDPRARGIACPVDLPNGTYRLFVRVRDTAGQWSPWDTHDWTQNVAVPSAPTGLTATPDDATFSVALSASVPGGDLVRFECSDDGGVTWRPVRGADAVPRSSTTTARDQDAPLGVARTYRAVAYSTDPAVASPPSGTATATVTTRTYVLTAVDNPTLGGEVGVQPTVEWTRPVAAGVFQGIGADYVTVVSDGAPKSRRTTLRLITETRAEWDQVAALAESNSTLVYRDPFGTVMYCRVVGDWTRAQAPIPEHIHTTGLPLVEVRPPHLEA